MIRRFRKKPVIIEAIQYTGDNEQEVNDFMKAKCIVTTKAVSIFTLEGEMKAVVGDWIIKGIIGEFYPCKPKIFEATYEEIF